MLGKGAAAHPEPATHIGRDHPHLALRNPENISAQVGSHPVGGLDPGIERVAFLQRVVEADCGAHFHRVGRHTTDREVQLDHMCRAGEG